MAGERVDVPDAGLLATVLDGAAGGLDPWRRGPALTVPDPVAPSAARVVPTATGVTWSFDGLLAEADPGTATPALLLTERPRRVPVDATEAAWLQALVSRRTRERSGPGSYADALLDALALAWAGEHDAALVRAAAVLERATLPHPARVLAARLAVVTGLAAGRVPRAAAAGRVWVRESPGDPAAAAWLLMAAGLSGDLRGVAELGGEEREPGAGDPWFAAAAAGPPVTAVVKSGVEVDALLELLATTPIESFTAATLFRIVSRWYDSGRPMQDLLGRWPEAARPTLLQVLEQAPLGVGPWWLALAQAWSETYGMSSGIAARVLATASQLEDEEALRWTGMMVQAGVRDLSPLRERATSPAVPARSQAVAAALGVEVFEDPESLPLLRDSAARVPVEELRDLLLTLDELAPALLPTVVTHAASTPSRTRYLADLLDEFGATEEAAALRAGVPAP